jgi:hypothetical protein
MKALLAGVSIAVLAGTATVHADDQYTTLVLINKIEFPIEASIFDKNGHNTDRTPGRVSTGGTITSKVMLDEKGYVSVEVKLSYQDEGGHLFNRCWDILTNANGQSQLPAQDVTKDVGTGNC